MTSRWFNKVLSIILILRLVMLKSIVPVLPAGLGIFTFLDTQCTITRVWLVFSDYESVTLLVVSFSDLFVDIPKLLFS